MTRTIVCFGDSNTHGASSTDQERYPRDARWPGVMRAALGPGFEVVEEGLSGRTTVFDSPLTPQRSGAEYLLPCLWSHQPVDLVIIMLGTNDLKRTYGLAAPEIASGASRLVDMARESLAGPEGLPPQVLLVAPVPLGPSSTESELWGFGASREESRKLARLYRLVAAQAGVAFLDAGAVAEIGGGDGVHLDPSAHAGLGAAMADAVRGMLPPD